MTGLREDSTPGKKKKVQDAHTHKKTKTRQAAAGQGVYNTRVFLYVTDNGKFMI